MGEINRSSGRFFHIPSDGRNPAVLPDIPSSLSMLKSGGYIWLNFLAPSREELMLLAEPPGLHPLAIEDCLDDQQILKIDDFPTKLRRAPGMNYFEMKVIYYFA